MTTFIPGEYRFYREQSEENSFYGTNEIFDAKFTKIRN